MKNRISFIFLACLCCLVFVPHAKAAGVTCITQIMYYEPTNSLFASAETFPDYDTLAYYTVGHWGYLLKNEEQIAEFNGLSYNSGVAWGQFFPYDPSADYAIESFPELGSKHNFPIGDTYEDYYNFIEWTNGYNVYYPQSYSFTGPGPAVGISFPSMILGTVFGIFTQGAMSGVPHHLRVHNDQDIIRTDLCGQLQKLIRFQVVDINHRAVGRVQIDEKPQEIKDTCSNTTVTLTTCSSSNVNAYGNFTDGIKTGCPHTGPSNCGFDFFNRWNYCMGSPYTPLERVEIAWMYYWATRTFVEIDGQRDMEDGTYKFPTGTGQ